VSITAPSGGATVNGNSVSLTADASDNVGVVGVQFKRDGINIGSEDTTSPYAVVWDTTVISNGSYVLTAVARDAAGNSTTSSTVTVTVSNGDAVAPTVSVTAPLAAATVSGSVTMSAIASDNVGVVDVQFKVDGGNVGTPDVGPSYDRQWDTTGYSDGSHTVTATARDAAGNSTVSTGVIVTVNNGGGGGGSSAVIAQRRGMFMRY
jgi:YD repeat-containing protein